MMNLKKIAESLTAVVLVMAISLCSLSGVVAFAAENDLQPGSVRILASVMESEEPKEFAGYWDGTDFYLEASDYAKITRYSYKEGSSALCYSLGMKEVLIQKDSGTMQILALQYRGKISRVVSMNGKTYLPMSKLLPWLNVTVEKGDDAATLEVTADPNSLWEYIGDTSDHKFNLYHQMQDFKGGTASLRAMMVTDVVTHTRWDAMYKTSLDVDGPSHYDQALYQDVFYEYSKELQDYEHGYLAAKTIEEQQELTTKEKQKEEQKTEITRDKIKFAEEMTEKTSGSWSKAQKINKMLNGLEKLAGFDEKEAILKLDDILRTQYMTEQFGSAVVFLNRCQQFRQALTDLAPVHPYLMAALETMQTFAVSEGTEMEYRDLLQYLSTDGQKLTATRNLPFKAGLENAARFYKNADGDITKLYLEEFITLFGKVLDSHASEVYESWAEIVLGLYGSYEPNIYLTAVKTFGLGFDLLLPETSKGFSEMRKMPVYSGVSETMWQISQALLQQEMTAENVGYVRQSQMLSLILSKKCYNAFKDVGNGQIFFEEAKNAIQTEQIDPVDKLLEELSLTTSCRVNDSVDGKEEAQAAIREYLKDVVSLTAGTETQPDDETPESEPTDSTPTQEGDTPIAEQLEQLYRDFVAQNFSGKYIALKADVTHDGVNDLIVVQYDDAEGWEGAYEQNGYVYTWQAGRIKQLKHESDATFFGYAGLQWYLKKLDNGMCNLITMEDNVHQGYNSATIKEISFTEQGAEIQEQPTYTAGKQGEPISDAEYDEFLRRQEQVIAETTEISPLNENIDASLILSRGRT